MSSAFQYIKGLRGTMKLDLFHIAPTGRMTHNDGKLQ